MALDLNKPRKKGRVVDDPKAREKMQKRAAKSSPFFLGDAQPDSDDLLLSRIKIKTGAGNTKEEIRQALEIINRRDQDAYNRMPYQLVYAIESFARSTNWIEVQQNLEYLAHGGYQGYSNHGGTITSVYRSPVPDDTTLPWWRRAEKRLRGR